MSQAADAANGRGDTTIEALRCLVQLAAVSGPVGVLEELGLGGSPSVFVSILSSALMLLCNSLRPASHRADSITAPSRVDRDITWTAMPDLDAHTCGPRPDTSVLSASVCRATAVGPWDPARPIPTPCRAGGPPPLVHAALGTPSNATPPAEPTEVLTDGFFHIQTLLEECVQSTTRPFLLAATLLDTLLDHFGDAPPVAAP